MSPSKAYSRTAGFCSAIEISSWINRSTVVQSILSSEFWDVTKRDAIRKMLWELLVVDWKLCMLRQWIRRQCLIISLFAFYVELSIRRIPPYNISTIFERYSDTKSLLNVTMFENLTKCFHFHSASCTVVETSAKSSQWSGILFPVAGPGWSRTCGENQTSRECQDHYCCCWFHSCRFKFLCEIWEIS